MNDEELEGRNIILFDGVCNLCNGSVTFVLRHERHHDLLFASLQSETGQKLLNWCGLSSDYSQAVIYIEDGKLHSGSSAALKIGQELKLPWSFFSGLGLIVPSIIRDWIYARISSHRYQWFGKRDTCMLPTENLKARFL